MRFEEEEEVEAALADGWVLIKLPPDDDPALNRLMFAFESSIGRGRRALLALGRTTSGSRVPHVMDPSRIGMGVHMGQGMSRDTIGRRSRGPASAMTRHLEATLVLVDGDEVSAEVVFTREGSPAVGVVTCVWFESVGIVRGHMRLEIERACKGSRAARALILFPRINSGLGRDLSELGGGTQQIGRSAKLAFHFNGPIIAAQAVMEQVVIGGGVTGRVARVVKGRVGCSG